MSPLYDAHNHLHDPRLDARRGGIGASVEAAGIAAAVVNGTSEADWPAVAALARDGLAGAPGLRVLPAFGLHPWFVVGPSDDRLSALESYLNGVPGASVGEIGLDAAVRGADAVAQREAFAAQLALAAARDLPATIHCVRAWDPLREVLRTTPLPRCGFLLHAWNGPAGQLSFLLDAGAHFSFSTIHLHPGSRNARERFAALPRERILIETDAPNRPPPAESNACPLPGPPGGRPLNHPANLVVVVRGLAETLAIAPEDAAALTTAAWNRLFGGVAGRAYPGPSARSA